MTAAAPESAMRAIRWRSISPCDIAQERIAAHPAVQPAPDEDRRNRGEHRDEKVMCDFSCPQAGDTIADHCNRARRKKVALQRRAKVLRRPPPHRSVYHQRRPVDPIRSAQHTGCESAAQQPGMTIVIEMRRLLPSRKIPKTAQSLPRARPSPIPDARCAAARFRAGIPPSVGMNSQPELRK